MLCFVDGMMGEFNAADTPFDGRDDTIPQHTPHCAGGGAGSAIPASTAPASALDAVKIALYLIVRVRAIRFGHFAPRKETNIGE